MTHLDKAKLASLILLAANAFAWIISTVLFDELDKAVPESDKPAE